MLFLQANPFNERILDVFSQTGDGRMNFEEFLDMMSQFSSKAPLNTKIDIAFRIYGKFVACLVVGERVGGLCCQVCLYNQWSFRFQWRWGNMRERSGEGGPLSNSTLCDWWQPEYRRQAESCQQCKLLHCMHIWTVITWKRGGLVGVERFETLHTSSQGTVPLLYSNRHSGIQRRCTTLCQRTTPNCVACRW